jgi:hypothetical protein
VLVGCGGYDPVSTEGGRMHRSLSLLIALLLAPLAAPAQCTVTQVTFASYGTGCNAVFPQQLPTLSGAWSAPSCTVTLTLAGFSGCCNTFLRGRVLVLGASRTNLPVPIFGPGCTLFAGLDVVLVFPTSAGNAFPFPLPAGMPRGTLYAQGMLEYFTTIGLTRDLAFSPGLALTIQ